MNATPPPETVTEPPSPGRLLVVDDEAIVLKLVKSVLSRANYQVATCGSASDALRLITQGQFDCVITDAVMPVMSGYDFVRALRKNPTFQDLPVLMLTRKRQTQDVKKAMDVGVTDYVIKPIDEQLLLDKVGLCVKKGKARSVFEIPVGGNESLADIRLTGRIVSVSESGVEVRLPFFPASGMALQLRSELFEQIGIETPMLRLLGCEDKPQDVHGFKDLPFLARFAFVGLPESELKKIRNWTMKQEIRRRK